MAPCHPLLAFSVNHPSQNAAFGTRRRLRRNERNTHTHDLCGGKGVSVNLMQQQTSASRSGCCCHRLCGGGGRKEGVEEGVRLDGGIGRGSDGAWERAETLGLQIATKRDTKEGNASDTMHACSWIVGCQCREGGMSTPVALFMGLPGSGFAHLSNVRRRFLSQAGTRMMCSSWEDPSVLLRYLWLQDLLCGRMLRKSDTRTRAVYGVSVWRPWASSQGVNSPCT